MIFAWLAVIACIAVGFRAIARLNKLAPTPGVHECEGTTAEQIAALNERLTDVAYELERVELLLPALRRVVLLSSTTCAVSVLAVQGAAGIGSRLPFAIGAFAAGLVGVAVLTQAGRLARQRASSLRSNWNLVSRRLARRSSRDV